jgi:flagellar FliL protein
MAKKKKEATEDGAPEADGAEGKKKFGKPVILGAAAAGLLVLGGGGYFLFGHKEESASKIEMKKFATIDMPEMTINLAGSAAQERPQFLKLKLVLEVDDPKAVTEITPLLPRVQDSFQIFMRELRPMDLEGSAGFYRLKEELMRRVNVAVYPNKVEALNFKEIIVQ